MRRNDIALCGHVAPGFEAVREAFVENFTQCHEVRAAWDGG
jgi:hypothetical protein